jgi:hypothetical protein
MELRYFVQCTSNDCIYTRSTSGRKKKDRLSRQVRGGSSRPVSIEPGRGLWFGLETTPLSPPRKIIFFFADSLTLNFCRGFSPLHRYILPLFSMFLFSLHFSHIFLLTPVIFSARVVSADIFPHSRWGWQYFLICQTYLHPWDPDLLMRSLVSAGQPWMILIVRLHLPELWSSGMRTRRRPVTWQDWRDPGSSSPGRPSWCVTLVT